MRLVHERLAAAPHEREAVPEEGLGPGGQGAARPTVLADARPTALAVVRARELTVDVVGVAVRPLAVRHGQHLVKVAVAVGPLPFPHEPPRPVVGVALNSQCHLVSWSHNNLSHEDLFFSVCKASPVPYRPPPPKAQRRQRAGECRRVVRVVEAEGETVNIHHGNRRTFLVYRVYMS